MFHSHKANAKAISFFDVWCEQLHRKQCNPFVRDVAFAFAFTWCEQTLSLTQK